MILENHWLILRPTEEKDLEFVLEAENHQENRPFILPYTRERHRKVITSQEEEHLLIVEKNTGSKLGFIV